MSGAHWSDPYAEWIVERFPELAGTPLYVRQQDEIPEAWHEQGCLGFTMPNLDLKLRDSLKARDQWQGRGLAIVVDADYFWSTTWGERCALLLHELGHCFAGWDSPFRREESRLTLLDEVLAIPGGREFWMKAHDIAEPDRTQHSKESHGPEFVRSGLHLWWRTRREVSLDDMLLFSPHYGSKDQEGCLAALMPELELGGNLIGITRTPMPTEFVRLFDGDQ